VALETWSHLWPALYIVETTRAVTDRAAELVATHPLRGGDAIHLASALLLAPDVVVAVWDEHVAAAAEAEGLTVLPGRYRVHERHAARPSVRRASGS
jgi:predicted nucleic acid-binding protein